MEISNQIARGMLAGTPLLTGAMNNLTKPISLGIKSVASTSTSSSQGGQVIVENHFYVDGQELTTKVMKRAVKELRGHGLKK
jgi:hypothetical protein